MTSFRSTRNAGGLSRRALMRLAAAGAVGCSVSGWIEALAANAAADPKRRKACILLWMSGGPTQTDTFDPKPGHANGGEFKAIDTAVAGVKISEHLPGLAKRMNDLALIRSMSTKEGDHGRATFTMRTGYLPAGPIRYPTLGSLLSKELGDDAAELPNFVSVAPVRALNPAAFSSGFLGPQFAPLVVGERAVTTPGGGRDARNLSFAVEDLNLPAGIDPHRSDSRLALLDAMRRDFGGRHPGVSPESHDDAYQRAVRLMRSSAGKAFELDEEPATLRDAYGRTPFGQGCLLARRLVERGVPFVEVTLSSAQSSGGLGWDTHAGNFDAVKQLSGVLDPAWSTLIDDLRTRGLLDSTLIVWMGEFGRTPKINSNAGRDHFPDAWTAVLGGGGIKGGQFVGDTGVDGMKVTDRPVAVPDFLATICKALGVDPMAQNLAEAGRPIRLVDPKAKPIQEVLA
ncbi:DUF1501 domain-containing protein [Paludisphaera borealis]|uniref:DUF1501 domain-containing protein n=1 Tax=Paludisphaera borealis TaxID=1387353 RepID=A0A1U7CJQ2_9BACT|nr:DUF1501 domain-containing protein [Paludisphaera borealis]APW59164.1 hypothetical protein BSF38_00578 [Paludisphaera borealis]